MKEVTFSAESLWSKRDQEIWDRIIDPSDDALTGKMGMASEIERLEFSIDLVQILSNEQRFVEILFDEKKKPNISLPLHRQQAYREFESALVHMRNALTLIKGNKMNSSK